MKKVTISLAVAVSSAMMAGSALAIDNNDVKPDQAGDWIVRGGVAGVFKTPQSYDYEMSSVIPSANFRTKVSNKKQLSPVGAATLSWLATDNLGLQLATTSSAKITQRQKQSKDTYTTINYRQTSLTAQYYLTNPSPWQPYAGLGVAYNTFKPKLAPVLQDTINATGWSGIETSTKIKNKITPVIEAGIDFNIDANWMVNTSVSYTRMDITQNTMVHSKGGEGNIKSKFRFNPVIAHLNVGYRF